MPPFEMSNGGFFDLSKTSSSALQATATAAAIESLVTLHDSSKRILPLCRSTEGSRSWSTGFSLPPCRASRYVWPFKSSSDSINGQFSRSATSRAFADIKPIAIQCAVESSISTCAASSLNAFTGSPPPTIRTSAAAGGRGPVRAAESGSVLSFIAARTEPRVPGVVQHLSCHARKSSCQFGRESRLPPSLMTRIRSVTTRSRRWLHPIFPMRSPRRHALAHKSKSWRRVPGGARQYSSNRANVRPPLKPIRHFRQE